MESPKVSIVIPYWGSYEKYLPECLESVSKQTYKNYEVIVVSDALNLPEGRNKGIRRAKGEYILCLDVDDKIEPTFLEKCLEANDDIVSTAQQEFGDSNNLWNTQKTHPVFSDFLEGNQINCCSLFKRKVWETVGGFDEDMTDGYEDWLFWAKATQKSFTITVIKDPLFLYRKHGHSMVQDAIAKHYELKQKIIDKLK